MADPVDSMKRVKQSDSIERLTGQRAADQDEIDSAAMALADAEARPTR